MPAGKAKVRFDPVSGIDLCPKPPRKAKPFDQVKAQQVIDTLCGMGQSDGHNVERFLSWKQVDREHDWEIEQQ